MNRDIPKKALIAAILRILRPLIRILLRNGVSYGAFSDLAKWVYVDVADKEFSIEGRKQTVSRISVITGLNRKEVSKQLEIEHPDDQPVNREYNRAARVISGWIHDERFLDKAHEPLLLKFDAEESSFVQLVKEYSGDIPARAILDELQRVGAVEILDNDLIQLNARAYIPKTGEVEKLHILGSDVSDLIDTIDHNLQGKGAPMFQRKVAYDNLPAEALPLLQKMAEEKGQTLLEELNEWLSTQDRDSNPEINGSGRKRAGVAVYYFEEDQDSGEDL
ncbi:MAG: hypothetical protein HUJ29_05415 [Gammaproteobacteria bacterium]|nr:hypothetical protein [Gammaproteobacteria bacterium]